MQVGFFWAEEQVVLHRRGPYQAQYDHSLQDSPAFAIRGWFQEPFLIFDRRAGNPRDD